MNATGIRNSKGCGSPSPRQISRFKVPTKYIPKMRSKLAEMLIISKATMFILLSLFLSNNSSFMEIFLADLAILPLLLVIPETVIRIFFSIEEYYHIPTRYGNSFKRYIDDMLTLPWSYIVSLILGILFTVLVSYEYNNAPLILWWQSGPTSAFCSLLSIYILRKLLKLDSGPLYDCLWIANSNGLDYGSGMAHSFFHGYLKLVLPKTGTQEKNLEELMKNYESTEQVKIELYKLFILIPKSLYCPTSLEDLRFPTISKSKSLPEKIITVAGVQDRVYKNSVYKIQTANRRLYVSAEYATPLKTFKDVVSHKGAHSNYYNKYRDEIVLQFYLTLQKVLKEDPECAPFCELIYFDDTDENGDYYDVGEILQARIHDIKRKMNQANRQHQD